MKTSRSFNSLDEEGPGPLLLNSVGEHGWEFIFQIFSAVARQSWPSISVLLESIVGFGQSGTGLSCYLKIQSKQETQP